MQQPIHVAKKDGIFYYLLLLTAFFLLLEISFFMQCNQTYLVDFTEVSNKLSIPVAVLPGIFYFICAQLLVHLIFCVVVWIMTEFIANVFRVQKKLRLGVIIWTVGILTALLANQYFFPNSKFSELTAVIFASRYVTKIVLIFLLLCCLILFTLTMMGLFKCIFNVKYAAKAVLLFFSGLGIVFGFSFYWSQSITLHDAATKERPNIILVGVDSLRPDFLSYFGHDKATPFFDSFLDNAAVFSQAVTPLARTFPSWTAILSGQYPRQIGIRTNLAQQRDVDFMNTLSAMLQRNGYQTLYATDETRFSNIDKNYGFDRIITPPMGLNDFLLGTFNDFPLSNLLVNSVIGKWLFPYSYANRPAAFTYDPNSFLNLLRPALQEQRSKPLFLAIHFCLPHFPYLLADVPARDLKLLARYETTVVRVDQQVGDFFALLKKYRLLDHAIVVLLSDHGEALELPGDRITEKALFMPAKESNVNIPAFYPPSLDNENINQSAGHGTDVLGLPQYHTLLAFKFYGTGQQQFGLISGIVSLLDIKPTILQLIHIPALASSGESLAPLIQGKHQALKQRHIFLETDFTPEAIRTIYPETRKVMLEGIELFQIDPITTRLIAKDSMNQMIIDSKQYADIYGEWMLALYPQNKHLQIPILINLVTGEWTNDLQSSFAYHSPALSMLNALKMFYGNEITNV